MIASHPSRRGAALASSALVTLLLTVGAWAAPVANDEVATAKPPASNAGTWSHAFVAYGEPKYPRDFKSFDYVNPNAPKGGTLYLGNPDRRTSFDKYNPFTTKGSEPTGVVILMFETLAVRSGDEPGTIYGLLAEEMLVPPDRSSITFRLNPKARFNNGDPVLAADVKHSFDMMTSKGASPAYRSQYDGVKGAVVLDERTIRFDLTDRTHDTIINVGTIPVFSRKWGLGADGKPKPFDQVIDEYPITSGPYTIAGTDSGRRIDFALDPNYWARDLNVRRGQFNFDRIVYRLFRDRSISMEAFKAGEFDIIQEFTPQQYVRLHDGPKWRDGRIIKKNFEYGMGKGMQAYLLNLRRPIFQDIRVREALDYSYDFEKINLYNQRRRSYSLFSNSDFAATGLPGPGELKLLEPFRAQVPPEVFGPSYQPPRTDTGPNALRENLKKARALLEEAGWKVAADGVLRNAKGEPFEFEYLEPESSNQFRTVIWQRNLAKLGINLKSRIVDFALYRKRLETFDFDTVTIRTPDFALPSALDYQESLGSKAATEEGSNNFRGLKNPAVDAMVAAMSGAKTYEELRDASRALDRIVTFGHYQVPQLYAPWYSVSYWNKFGIPKTYPKYYTIDESGDWPVWAVTAWWSKDAEAMVGQASGAPKS
jgi:peptide/nickel transport system substrate-binding protein/microcin C transport system substrate-binding protein